MKIKENISEVQIQEQLIYFTTEFKTASKFMKNAADLIIDGANNSILPMKQLKIHRTCFRTCAPRYCPRFIYVK